MSGKNEIGTMISRPSVKDAETTPFDSSPPRHGLADLSGGRFPAGRAEPVPRDGVCPTTVGLILIRQERAKREEFAVEPAQRSACPAVDA